MTAEDLGDAARHLLGDTTSILNEGFAGARYSATVDLVQVAASHLRSGNRPAAAECLERASKLQLDPARRSGLTALAGLLRLG